jgi:hypothetical protein
MDANVIRFLLKRPPRGDAENFDQDAGMVQSFTPRAPIERGPREVIGKYLLIVLSSFLEMPRPIARASPAPRDANQPVWVEIFGHLSRANSPYLATREKRH